MDPRTLFSLIDEIQGLSSVEEIHAFCARLCRDSGFDHFLFGARICTSFAQPQSVIVSGYPDAWWEHYKQRGFMPQDPVLAYSIRQNLPRDWHTIAVQYSSEPGRLVMDEARDFGLKSGLVCPTHGAGGAFALLTFSASRDYLHLDASVHARLPQLHLLASYLHEALLRTVEIREISHPTTLTEREKECLLWGAEGKTAWEIGQILNISERTVIFHLQNACLKLDVSNRQQAIARAISSGIITPQFS